MYTDVLEFLGCGWLPLESSWTLKWDDFQHCSVLRPHEFSQIGDTLLIPLHYFPYVDWCKGQQNLPFHKLLHRAHAGEPVLLVSVKGFKEARFWFWYLYREHLFWCYQYLKMEHLFNVHKIITQNVERVRMRNLYLKFSEARRGNFSPNFSFELPASILGNPASSLHFSSLIREGLMGLFLNNNKETSHYMNLVTLEVVSWAL